MKIGSFLAVAMVATAMGLADMSGRWEDLAYEHVAAFLKTFQAILAASAAWFVAWLRTRGKDKQIDRLTEIVESQARALQRAASRHGVDIHSLCVAESGAVKRTSSGRFEAPEQCDLLPGMTEKLVRAIEETGSVTMDDVAAARAEHRRRKKRGNP